MRSASQHLWPRSVRIFTLLGAAAVVYALTMLYVRARLPDLLQYSAFMSRTLTWRQHLDLSPAAFATLLFLLFGIPAFLPSPISGRLNLVLLVIVAAWSLQDAWLAALAVPTLGVKVDLQSTLRVQVISFLALLVAATVFVHTRRSAVFAARLAFAALMALFVVLFAAPGTVGEGL